MPALLPSSLRPRRSSNRRTAQPHTGYPSRRGCSLPRTPPQGHHQQRTGDPPPRFPQPGSPGLAAKEPPRAAQMHLPVPLAQPAVTSSGSGGRFPGSDPAAAASRPTPRVPAMLQASPDPRRHFRQRHDRVGLGAGPSGSEGAGRALGGAGPACARRGDAGGRRRRERARRKMAAAMLGFGAVCAQRAAAARPEREARRRR